MKYILRHKKYKTYYCFDNEDKYKHYSVDGTKAYKFNRVSSANKILSKFKHPENWEIVEIKEKRK